MAIAFVRAYGIGTAADLSNTSITIDTTGLGANGAIAVFIIGGHVAGSMVGKAFSTPTLGGSSTGWTERIGETINAASNSGMMGAWVCLNPASSASVSLALAWTTAIGVGDRIAAVIALYSGVASNGTAFTADNDGGSTTTDTMTNAPGAGNLTVGAWSHGSAISSVTSGTLRGSILNAATDYSNGCIAFIEGNTAAFSSGSADSNIGLQIELVAGAAAGDSTSGPYGPGLLACGPFGPMAFQWIQLSGTDGPTFATVEAVAAGSSATSGTVTAVVTKEATASGSSATSGTVTAVVTVEATASGSSSTSGAATAVVTVEAVASGSSATSGSASATVDHIVSATAAGSSATSGSVTAVVTKVVTAAGSSASSGTATAVVTVEAVATGSSASSGSATATVQSAGTVEAVAAGSSSTSGTVTAVVTVPVVVAGSSATSGTATAVVTVPATASGTSTTSGVVTAVVTVNAVATGSSATSGTATATSSTPGIVQAVATGTSATSGTATAFASGALPPLVPPFAAFLNGYEASTGGATRATTRVTQTVTLTVNTTPRSRAVNTTPAGDT